MENESEIVNESIHGTDSSVSKTEVASVQSTKAMKKKTMTLKQEINFVRRSFESQKGYLVTVEIKRVTESQAMIHGVVYYIQEGKPDLIAYEGNLMYPINDQNFKDSQFVIAFNIGEESLADKIQSLIKDNASGAMSSIISFIANIGFKIGVQHIH